MEKEKKKNEQPEQPLYENTASTSFSWRRRKKKKKRKTKTGRQIFPTRSYRYGVTDRADIRYHKQRPRRVFHDERWLSWRSPTVHLWTGNWPGQFDASYVPFRSHALLSSSLERSVNTGMVGFERRNRYPRRGIVNHQKVVKLGRRKKKKNNRTRITINHLLVVKLLMK